MAENDIVALKELASGGFLEVALAPADISAAPASHTHVAADITDLTSAAAGALYDGALSIAGAVVSDANLRLINGDDHEAILGYENITSNRFINLPNASGTLALTSDFAAPPAIGNTTPAAGSFTTLTAAPTSGSALTLTGGTVTASAPLISATQTWNNSGVTFTGLAATITNTASATDSLVARLTVGSTNVFEVDGRGLTTLRKVATSTDFVNVFTVRRGTTQVFAVRDDGVATISGSQILSCGNTEVKSSGLTHGFASNLFWTGTTTYVLELYGSTNPHSFNIYGTRTSTTNFQRLTIKTKAVTLSALSGESVATTTGLIPDGAVLVGLTTRVSTAITGATGYDIGDGSDADRWGANVAIALNTSSDNTNWTAGTIQCFTAAQEVTLTAVGSNFTGGAVVIVAHYLAGEAD